MPSRAPLPPGHRLGDYEIVREIGRGGFGTVYESRAIADGAIVAIKTMHRVNPGDADSLLLRFRREIKNLSRLHHPNIVAIHSAGEHDGVPYLVMDLVRGRTLTDYAGELAFLGPRERLAKLLGLFIKLTNAIDYAHSHEIVHRDLTPRNIFILHESDEPVILDFGIAKCLTDTTLTQGVESPGTPPYRAPEQIDVKRKVSEKLIDVWAIGVNLYRIFTNDHPFHGADAHSLSSQILMERPVRPRKLNPAIPLALERLILGCLEKDARRRPPSMRALADEFEKLVETLNLGPLIGPTASAAGDPRVSSTISESPAAARPARRRHQARIVWSVLIAVAVISAGAHWWPRSPDVSIEPPALSVLRADGTSLTVGERIAVADAEELTLRARSRSRIDDVLVAEGCEVLSAKVDADGRSFRIRVESGAEPIAVMIRVLDTEGRSSEFRFGIEAREDRPAPPAAAPRLTLARASEGDASETWTPASPAKVIDGEQFVLEARSVDGIDVASLALVAFELKSQEALEDGVRFQLRTRLPAFRADGRVTLRSTTGAESSLDVPLELQLRGVVARVERLSSALLVEGGDGKERESTFFVPAWEADLVLVPQFLPGFETTWQACFEGLTMARFPLRREGDQLLGRVIVPESARSEETTFLLRVGIQERGDSGVHFGDTAPARIKFDASGPRLLVEQREGANWRAVDPDKPLAGNLDTFRCGAEDANGPAQLQITLDGQLSEPKSIRVGEREFVRGDPGPGDHTIVISATDALGNRSSQTFALSIPEPPLPKLATPFWADGIEAFPDPTVVRDPELRKRIVATGFAWRVQHRLSAIEMVLIPPGTYRRGAVEGDAEVDAEVELPAHEVTIARPFYLGRDEVTVAQYRRLVPGHAIGQFRGQRLDADDQPIVRITWEEADRYCRAFAMRLPLDEEWELACRAGERTKYPWGDRLELGAGFDNVFDLSAREAIRETRPAAPWNDGAIVSECAGSGGCNGFGLRHLAGNVREWVAGAFDAQEYSRKVGVVAPAPGLKGLLRVARGGSWWEAPELSRCSHRGRFPGTFAESYIGLRAAADP